MKNKIVLFMIWFMLFPNIINAEQRTYSATAICGSNYNVNRNDFVYDNPKTYTCSNGNTNPYITTIQDSCITQSQNVCYPGDIVKCSVTLDYDCSRINNKNGDKFTTTTKKTTTKRRSTTKSTTTITTTTIPIPSNTKLSSLVLSSGNINFNKDTYEYSINIDSNVNSIDVTAIPEDETSRVEILNNTNIENGSVIKIIVTGTDNSISEYKINVSKEVYIMSSNAKLKSLSVEGYTLNFNNKINEYTLIISEEDKELNIDYETEDEKAIATITGNSNLSDGSKIVLDVTAEDGTLNSYIINITVKRKSNVLSILFIIILILAIIAGAYYMYKKFIASKKGEKYEYE